MQEGCKERMVVRQQRGENDTWAFSLHPDCGKSHGHNTTGDGGHKAEGAPRWSDASSSRSLAQLREEIIHLQRGERRGVGEGGSAEEGGIAEEGRIAEGRTLNLMEREGRGGEGRSSTRS